MVYISSTGLGNLVNILELQDYASSHFELRWKIVSDGYKMFLETDKLSWPDEGEDICTKIEWKTDMLNPTTWGDEVVLSLASNLLELDINIIPAFRESGFDPVSGVTTIKPLVCAKHQAIHLFHFSESDFTSAHYESVFPRCGDIIFIEDDVQKQHRVTLVTSLVKSLNNTKKILEENPLEIPLANLRLWLRLL